jgi:hypothetical protein
MRQAFGAQYGRETLPVPDWSAGLQLEDLSSLVANVVGFGADVRTLYFSRQGTGERGSADSAGRNGFFQMQGDLYLSIRLAKKVSVFLKKGLYSGFEAYGLLHVLPANGYLKLGKFLPAYGTRTDDHTSYIRTVTGFSPEQGRPELTGGEAAISPGPFTILGGFYNADDGFGSAVGNDKAFLGRAEGLFALSEEVHLGLGGNVFVTTLPGGTRRTLYGGLGSLSIGEMTLLGEVDAVRSRNGGVTTTGLVTFAEASYVVTPGVDLKLGYDFFDPDVDRKTGAQSRFSAGVEFFPLPGVELRPVYRFVREEPTDRKNNELQVIIHFYL